MTVSVHEALWAEIVKVFNNVIPGGIARPILNAIDRPELVSTIEGAAAEIAAAAPAIGAIDPSAAAVAGVVGAVAEAVANAGATTQAPAPEATGAAGS